MKYDVGDRVLFTYPYGPRPRPVYPGTIVKIERGMYLVHTDESVGLRDHGEGLHECFHQHYALDKDLKHED